MIDSPSRWAQVFPSVFACVFAEANSSKKPDIRPEQMSGAISGHSLIIIQAYMYLQSDDCNCYTHNVEGLWKIMAIFLRVILVVHR